MIRLGRVEATGGFLLLLAALYYLDGHGVLPWAVLACICHEAGHGMAIHFLGGKVARLRLSAAGAELRLSARRPLDHRAQIVAALAGPVVNLVLGLVSAQLGRILGERCFLFSGLNFCLAFFNLLPVHQLDGGWALRHIAQWLFPGERAERVLRAVSAGTVLGLLAAGGWMLWTTGHNFTLMLTAGWLLFAAVRERRRVEGTWR